MSNHFNRNIVAKLAAEDEQAQLDELAFREAEEARESGSSTSEEPKTVSSKIAREVKAVTQEESSEPKANSIKDAPSEGRDAELEELSKEIAELEAANAKAKAELDKEKANSPRGRLVAAVDKVLRSIRVYGGVAAVAGTLAAGATELYDYKEKADQNQADWRALAPYALTPNSPEIYEFEGREYSGSQLLAYIVDGSTDQLHLQTLEQITRFGAKPTQEQIQRAAKVYSSLAKNEKQGGYFGHHDINKYESAFVLKNFLLPHLDLSNHNSQPDFEEHLKELRTIAIPEHNAELARSVFQADIVDAGHIKAKVTYDKDQKEGRKVELEVTTDAVIAILNNYNFFAKSVTDTTILGESKYFGKQNIPIKAYEVLLEEIAKSKHYSNPDFIKALTNCADQNTEFRSEIQKALNTLDAVTQSGKEIKALQQKLSAKKK